MEEAKGLDCIRRGDRGELAALKEETGCIRRGDGVELAGLEEETARITRGDEGALLEETRCIT